MSISKDELLEKIQVLERRVLVLECKHNYAFVERWKSRWTLRNLYLPPPQWEEAGSLWRCTKCRHKLLLGYSDKPAP